MGRRELPPIISATPMPNRPLIVRLRNWVGDVTLGLPLLQRLTNADYSLTLVGKPWARDLLAGHGWPVHVLPKKLGERVRLLRKLRNEALQSDPSFCQRINAIALPYSFSSALDMRLAGLRTLGHAHEGRSWLLARSIARTNTQHEIANYWQLGDSLLGAAAPLPEQIDLRVSGEHQERATALIAEHGLSRGFVVVCPFSGGTFEGQDKTWPGFADFVTKALPSLGYPIVICPGPGEAGAAQQHFATAVVMSNVDLGTYAALLQAASLMISNDTGPGHIAAAVGTPVLSVLGPSDPAQWRAWGPKVHLVQGQQPGRDWPDIGAVLAAAQRLLAQR